MTKGKHKVASDHRRQQRLDQTLDDIRAEIAKEKDLLAAASKVVPVVDALEAPSG